jgi:hypothetical protein
VNTRVFDNRVDNNGSIAYKGAHCTLFLFPFLEGIHLLASSGFISAAVTQLEHEKMPSRLDVAEEATTQRRYCRISKTD